MSPGSQGKRAAGFAACLSLLRVPRAPPQQRSSQLSLLRSRAPRRHPPALCSHRAFLPGRVPAFWNLPTGTCARVATTCSGRPSVKTEHAWVSAALSGQCLLPQRPVHPGRCRLYGDSRVRSLVAHPPGLSCACETPPKVPAASPALPLSHGPRGQRLGTTKLFFPREGCAFFKGWDFNYNFSALSRT